MCGVISHGPAKGYMNKKLKNHYLLLIRPQTLQNLWQCAYYIMFFAITIIYMTISLTNAQLS